MTFLLTFCLHSAHPPDGTLCTLSTLSFMEELSIYPRVHVHPQETKLIGDSAHPLALPFGWLAVFLFFVWPKANNSAPFGGTPICQCPYVPSIHPSIHPFFCVACGYVNSLHTDCTQAAGFASRIRSLPLRCARSISRNASRSTSCTNCLVCKPMEDAFVLTVNGEDQTASSLASAA